LGARIFAVADTLDAITSDRPYRAAQSTRAALDEIARHGGTQFDPEVVKTFLSMPESIWDDLRRQINSQINRYNYPEKIAAKAGAGAER
jgi:HD-GYP domain-containing protein (c-di-GMP phosphodiesterase class II)